MVLDISLNKLSLCRIQSINLQCSWFDRFLYGRNIDLIWPVEHPYEIQIPRINYQISLEMNACATCFCKGSTINLFTYNFFQLIIRKKIGSKLKTGAIGCKINLRIYIQLCFQNNFEN